MTATISPTTGAQSGSPAGSPPAAQETPGTVAGDAGTAPRPPAAHLSATHPPATTQSRRNRLLFGPQARWVRPSAALLLIVTAALYLWNLEATGYANSFYAAAIQAGTKDWTALLFGSLDAGNAITVDKPPAALWIPALAGRIFGFSALSMLIPQALMGVAAVGLLYLTVKRVTGPAAGLLAGGALALTPVAALMFRFNNPDAMLTLCLVLAAYLTTRAIEKAGWKWLAAAGAVIGLAFLSKMLQGFLIVPGLALAYLWAAPTTLGRRLLHLLAAAAGIAVVAGSYLVLFQLTPTSVRPYMAGSETNSFLELTFGYNGLGRITGSGGGMPAGGNLGGNFGGNAGGPGGNGNVGFGGTAGITRMFGTSFGGEVSWLLPAALILLAAGLWFTQREVRTSKTRAALLLWGGWLVITAGIFSFMSGTVHPYYAVALAPAIAALAGIGSLELWRGRAYWPARVVLAVTVLATSVWSAVLLGRDPAWLPGLRVIVVVLGVLAATALLLRADSLAALPARFRKAATAGVVILALLAGGLGSTAWTLATVAQPHSGSIPTSGPTASAMGGGFGAAGRAGSDGADGGAAGGGPGGETTSAELTALLKSSDAKWSAIVSGATQAASLELATGTSVIALGGWNGGDPYPTLAQFQAMVDRGEIGYFISGGMGGMGGGRGGNSEVATWVAANYQAQTVGNTTVYKLGA
ncbi:glycosyltransferase family 39 protein [Arthrobacter sp. NPDC056886]|uniref:glycosyltransferase family 39 protein n=1 Tax=Arthrobacter sp. NPDC056886 TaxID=3345960 RepID=UPI003673222E